MNSSVLPPSSKKKSYLRFRNKGEKQSNRSSILASLDASLHETKPPSASSGDLRPLVKRSSFLDAGNPLNDSWGNMDVDMHPSIKSSDVIQAPLEGNTKLPQKTQGSSPPSKLKLDPTSPDGGSFGKSKCYPKRRRPKAAIAA